MDVELAEVRDFLAEHPPFDTLPAEVLAALVDAARSAGRTEDDHVLATLHGGSTEQVTIATTLAAAAPTPCRTRRMSSTTIDGATAQSRAATTLTAMPISSGRRRP